MFFDYNSQKSWPAQLVEKASQSSSPRTSEDSRLGTTALDKSEIILPATEERFMTCPTLVEETNYLCIGDLKTGLLLTALCGTTLRLSPGAGIDAEFSG